MLRVAVLELPRFVTIGLVAVALASIGLFVSALMPTLVYTFPALQPSNYRPRRAGRTQRRLARLKTRPQVNLTQIVNAKFEVNAVSTLIRPRESLSVRCHSIPANWNLSRPSCVGETTKRSPIPSKAETKPKKRKAAFKDKLLPIEASPAAVLKSARETILLTSRRGRPSFKRAFSSFRQTDTIPEEPIEQDTEITNLERSTKSIMGTKPISAAGISGATAKLIKSCKLDVPVKVVTRESRRIIGAVSNNRDDESKARKLFNNSIMLKKRPMFRRNVTEV